MKFDEAVKKIQAGEKVRRPCMNQGVYLTHEYGEIYGVNNGVPFDFKLSFESADAIDWEIYKEVDNWNARSMLICEGEVLPSSSLTEKDLRELKEKIKNDEEKRFIQLYGDLNYSDYGEVNVKKLIQEFEDNLKKDKNKRFGL